MGPLSVLALAAQLGAGVPPALDGTWDVARVFRPGPAAAARELPAESTTVVRLTLATQPSGWIVGTLEWRRRGTPDRTRVQDP